MLAKCPNNEYILSFTMFSFNFSWIERTQRFRELNDSRVTASKQWPSGWPPLKALMLNIDLFWQPGFSAKNKNEPISLKRLKSPNYPDHKFLYKQFLSLQKKCESDEVCLLTFNVSLIATFLDHDLFLGGRHPRQPHTTYTSFKGYNVHKWCGPAPPLCTAARSWCRSARPAPRAAIPSSAQTPGGHQRHCPASPPCTCTCTWYRTIQRWLLWSKWLRGKSDLWHFQCFVRFYYIAVEH